MEDDAVLADYIATQEGRVRCIRYSRYHGG